MNKATKPQNIPEALAQVKTILEAARQEQQVPGLSIAVVHDQRVLWSQGIGMANLQAQHPATPHTLYGVGSITKLLTATALLHLRDQGRLLLDEPVERYVPTFILASRFADPRPPTFRQLLSHTAGLPREAPLDYWQSQVFPSAVLVLESLKQTELIFEPLHSYKYSNLGYAILGYALEQIAHQPYQHYLTEQILRPLGMDQSGYEISRLDNTRLATGYMLKQGGIAQRETTPPDYRALTSAMGLYSSVEDLTRFLSLQFHEGPADNTHVLGASTLREMRTPVYLAPDWQSAMALSWKVERIGEHTALTHGGGVYGYTTSVMIVPEVKLGVAISTNAFFEDSDWRPAPWSRVILETLLPLISASNTQATLYASQQDWHRYLGRYEVPGFAEVDIALVDGQLAVRRPGNAGIWMILIPEQRHCFRVQGGILDGEHVVFQVDEAGVVKQIQAGSFTLSKCHS
jgi:D-alanyl-D-alanine carboxypeptidase